MNAEAIIEKYGDVEDRDETDEDSEDTDEDGSGSEPDGDFYNYRSTVRINDPSTTEESTEENSFAVLSVSPTTNKAVSFHLCEIHLIFLVIVFSLIEK
jgi:hypothetical protein